MHKEASEELRVRFILGPAGAFEQKVTVWRLLFACVI